MKKKLTTITIGIPALNESANIKRLLVELLSLDFSSFTLSQILVVDDGSTDDTVQKIKEVKSRLIRVLRHKTRAGIVKTQNDIIAHVKSDILVMLDADVLPKNKTLIQNIVRPIIENKADLVGGSVESLPGRGIIERALSRSSQFKNAVYESINSQDNVYLCHGRVRAMSKNFYFDFRWIENVPEDAYSYLVSKKKKRKFVYAKDAVVVFRSPTTIAEHAKQRVRFLDSKNVLGAKFSRKQLAREYALPTQLVMSIFFLYLLRYPSEMLTYVFATLYIRFFVSVHKIDHSKHQIAVTSKNLSL